MLLTSQFLELFRRENYAVTLALNEERQLENVMDSVLSKRTIDGIWDKEYSMVPMDELSGREEAEPIPQTNMTMGYTVYGSICSEASSKIGLSKELKLRGKEFSSAGGVDEPKFAGYIADTIGRAYQVRWAQKQRKLAAKMFNFGGIQAGQDRKSVV